MHHYDAEITILPTAAGGKSVAVRSGYRCSAVVAGDQHGAVVEFEAPPERLPGGSANVRLSFTFPEISCPMIEEGERYPIMESPREVGTLRILVDAWNRIEDITRVGEVVTAIVTKTAGTLAFIALPKGGTSMLSSADVGLRPWDDIADRLQTGDMVTVRILDIDLFHRRISLEAIDNKPSVG